MTKSRQTENRPQRYRTAFVGAAILLALTFWAPQALIAQHGSSPKTVITVRDTVDYLNEADAGGRRGLLYVNGRIVDTVDIDFGVHVVGRDSILFLPVREQDITSHVLAHGGKRKELKAQFPYFSDYFSSPTVVGKTLHYWGLRQMPDEQFRIYAMRFDFARAHLDSLPLNYFGAATDYRWWFSPPIVTGDRVVYGNECFTYVVDKCYKRFKLRSDPMPGISSEACDTTAKRR